jgi:hypothetical protein
MLHLVAHLTHVHQWFFLRIHGILLITHERILSDAGEKRFSYAFSSLHTDRGADSLSAFPSTTFPRWRPLNIPTTSFSMQHFLLNKLLFPFFFLPEQQKNKRVEKRKKNLGVPLSNGMEKVLGKENLFTKKEKKNKENEKQAEKVF